MDIVSVILPTYNREAYIDKAIKSVISQSYKNIELIIIDDGSTDNTENIIKPFLIDNRITYIKQSNAGAASARNSGILEATGRYIAFIDSDDIWTKDKIYLQLLILNSLPMVSAVFNDFSGTYKNGSVEKSHLKTYFSVLNDYSLTYQDIFTNKKILQYENQNIQLYWGNIYKTMLFGNLILTSTFIVRRKIFERLKGFDTRYETLEDYDLFLKITKEHEVAFIDSPLVNYRYSQNQLSGNDFYAKLCINILDIFDKNIQKMDIYFLKKQKKTIKKHRGLIYSRLAYYYFSRNSMKLASSYYWQGIKNNPQNIKNYIYFLFSTLPKAATNIIRKYKKSSNRSPG